MTASDMGPLVVFVGACLTIGLIIIWSVWTIQWFYERLCETLEAIIGKEDPSGPYH